MLISSCRRRVPVSMSSFLKVGASDRILEDILHLFCVLLHKQKCENEEFWGSFCWNYFLNPAYLSCYPLQMLMVSWLLVFFSPACEFKMAFW